ncbi:MAG: tight adherence protein [Actinomycetota bacterium]|jgi:tight adherence protein C|nr:tight adherence protein [Actinomycetota bacterium]
MSYLTVAVGGCFVMIAVLAYLVLSQADERVTARASLRQLDGYEIDNLRERDMLKPIGERVVVPFSQWLTSVGKRFAGITYIARTRHKLTVAGTPSAEAIDRFLAVRVITAALIPVTVVAYFTFFPALGLHGKTNLLVMIMLILIVGLGPEAVLNRRMADRQRKIRIALPDILDVLTISVEAGLGFEQALDRTVTSVPGPLSEEFQRVLGEIRAGSSRADAMRQLDERTDVPEVRSFVLAILQADTFGISIGRVLRAQSDEMRIKRRQLAQEAAQKVPVKMLVPMVFCIFPALFVVVLGPAAINIQQNFK